MSDSSCLRCGRCCTSFGVCITPSDIVRIAEDTGREPSSFAASIPEPPDRERNEPSILIDGERSLIVLKWKEKSDARVCFFYFESDKFGVCESKNKGCSIYGSRPFLCRTYPFRKNRNGLCDMRSRSCPTRWSPDDAGKKVYQADLARYEQEIGSYNVIADEWNKKHKGGLEAFLRYICGKQK